MKHLLILGHGVLAALGSKEARQGLSVMLELTKAVGKLKPGEPPAPSL